MKWKFLIACLFSVWFLNPSHAQKDAPKLVVGIVVDQMCYDYLYRFYPHFSKDGFKRLMDKGSHFRNVQYNYVPTFTGPGHASIFTGTTPANHGIVANDWYHRPYGRETNCVQDTTVQSVGTSSDYGMRSPHFLRANTITDQLKLTYPDSKVIGVSIKDRSAILPAGHMSDGSYWYDYATGKFVTSSYYRDALPQWVQDFNAQQLALNYSSQPWNLLYPASSYTYASQDDSPYEVLVGGKEKPVFPYDFSALDSTKRLELFTIMPAANTFLRLFAQAAITGEALGTDKVTDFLTLSYSTPDIAGHAFGPYSLEMEDMYYRLDKELEQLFAFLDKQVGKGQYTLFLTADHAVVPVPQFLTDHKLPGGYVFMSAISKTLSQKCLEEFQVDPIDRIENNNIYLKKEYAENEFTDKIVAFLKNELLRYDDIKAVYTRNDLEFPANDAWMRMVQLGFDKERSGELIFLLQPGFLAKSSDTPSSHQGTSHGSAFNYDTHVPVLFYGKGVPVQEVFTPYEIVDIVATLVHVLDVQRPNAAIGKPMLELFQAVKR